MTHEQAVRLVLDTIRGRALGGETRDLPLDAPLSELGLDSLSLVTVVSGLEAAVGRRFPDEYWEDRPLLRVRDLVEAVERAGAAPQRARRGPLAPAAVARVPWRVYSRLEVVLLERLLDEPLPEPAPPPGVNLRRANAADDASLAELWPRRRRRGARRRLRVWRGRGHVPLAAFERDRALALDWLHDTDPEAGVAASDAGTCLGIDLRVRAGHEGSGVGVALIAFSLATARELGYRRQAAYVARDNQTMRLACTALLGFTEFGYGRRTTLLGKNRWTWSRDGVSGRGNRLDV